MRSWRAVVIAVVLGVQLLALAYARTADTRYLAWAPYDQISTYTLAVELDGRPLDGQEIVARYPIGLWPDGAGAVGRENRAISHVFREIERWEAVLDDDTTVVVEVTYRVNGGEEQSWTWSD